ncbi:MAG: CRISPR-associated protein Cas4 [Clostridia bacterium]|nr:CRISPR-associated protein Cas4 [Clostridia bacterium]
MNQDPLMISALQHFAFCRRQWALIHIEQVWQDNARTIEGNLMHRRAHDEKQVEKRGDLIIMRGLRVQSARMNVTGICDVVEFHRHPTGVCLPDYDGLWLPYPVEYKRGKPKAHDADELQLCAQAMCLEEMLLCDVPEGSLYYGEPHRRARVLFTADMRTRVEAMLAEMHQYTQRGYTPRPSPTKGCNACSLKDLCLSKLHKTQSVASYIRLSMKEDDA